MATKTTKQPSTQTLTILNMKVLDEFIATGKKAASYKKFYPDCKNMSVAAVNMNKLLNKAKAQLYIKDRMEQLQKPTIATQEEVLEYFTRVVRGEEKDQLGFEVPARDRNKEAELLGKCYGVFKDVNVNMNVVKVVKDDIPE